MSTDKASLNSAVGVSNPLSRTGEDPGPTGRTSKLVPSSQSNRFKLSRGVLDTISRDGTKSPEEAGKDSMEHFARNWGSLDKNQLDTISRDGTKSPEEAERDAHERFARHWGSLNKDQRDSISRDVGDDTEGETEEQRFAGVLASLTVENRKAVLPGDTKPKQPTNSGDTEPPAEERE